MVVLASIFFPYLEMSADHIGSGPSYQDYIHHETSYGGYINHGHHASDGGIILNHCYLSFSNPLGVYCNCHKKYFSSENPSEEPENHITSLDSQDFDANHATHPSQNHNHERSFKRRLTISGASADSSRCERILHLFSVTSNDSAGLPAKRQRIGDFVKITLDIAKESTDVGNPLKAVLAGLRALVEHYEVFVR